MKKSLIALAALAATASFAQSSVTISGGINVGIMDTGLSGAKAVVSHLGNGANAINIETLEDLGGGLKGGFTSQIRFNGATGDMNSSGTGSALFHAANAYVGGGFGTVRVGKIAEASNCGLDPWGCTGGAGLNAGAPSTISALVGAGTQAGSVSYATPTVAGFSAGYQSTVSTRTNERRVLNINYANGPLSALYLQVNNSGNTAANSLAATTTAVGTGTPAAATYTTTVGPTITDVKAKYTSIGASYDLGMAKIAAWNAVTKDASDVTTADVTAIAATVPMGSFSLLAGYAKDKKKASNADTKMALGVNYSLSKRTTLGADVFKQDAVGSSTGFVVRVGHTF